MADNNGNNAPGAPTTHSSNNGPTGFFDLPREIRDEIYDLSHYHKVANVDARKPWYKPEDDATGAFNFTFTASQPHAQRVNRQFAEEYHERTPNPTPLLITQTRPIKAVSAAIPVPPKSLSLRARANVREVHLKLVIGDDKDDWRLPAFNEESSPIKHGVHGKTWGLSNAIAELTSDFVNMQVTRVNAAFDHMANFDDVLHDVSSVATYFFDPTARRQLPDPPAEIEIEHSGTAEPRRLASWNVIPPPHAMPRLPGHEFLQSDWELHGQVHEECHAAKVAALPAKYKTFPGLVQEAIVQQIRNDRDKNWSSPDLLPRENESKG